MTRGRKVRVDTTAVETDIHFLTDSGLLGDGVRVVSRLRRRAKAALGEASAGQGEAFCSRVRTVRRLSQQLHRERLVEIGRWAFGVQVARAAPDTSPNAGLARAGSAAIDELRRFALNHDGDPRRGETIYFDPKGIGCGRCHSAGGQGTATIGPDLTGLAAKHDRAELIRSVLEPSSRIATGYQPVVVATHDGKLLTGVVRAEINELLELADAEAQLTRVPKRDIAVRRAGAVSIMPAQLVDAVGRVAQPHRVKCAPNSALSDELWFVGFVERVMKTARIPHAPSTPLPELAEFLAPFRVHFTRSEGPAALERYLTGLLTEHPNKNCDTLAQVVPGTSEQSLQGLLTAMAWDEEDLNRQRVERLLRLGTEGDSVLIVDDTGFAKQGRCSVGVARQYSVSFRQGCLNPFG